MKVNIEGIGCFDVKQNKIPKLMEVISSIGGVRIQEENKLREVNGGAFTGRELINE